ncbi:MAG: hypothetical protein RBT39_16210 [Azoarcus sp.]|jgi:hypothetical protein|nr:hypothetical protein [Azoarcus sp.]MDX9839105.1 hypothetical protein [Azoarcus sp.]
MEYTPEQIDSIVRKANRLRSEEIGRLIAAGYNGTRQLFASVMHKLTQPAHHAHH